MRDLDLALRELFTSFPPYLRRALRVYQQVGDVDVAAQELAIDSDTLRSYLSTVKGRLNDVYIAYENYNSGTSDREEAAQDGERPDILPAI